MKPFRFAAGIRGAATAAEFVQGVRQVEALGYSTLMLSDHLIDQFAPMRFHSREGAFLVGPHKPAVPRDIRGENRGQPAFAAFGGQSGAP